MSRPSNRSDRTLNSDPSIPSQAKACEPNPDGPHPSLYHYLRVQLYTDLERGNLQDPKIWEICTALCNSAGSKHLAPHASRSMQMANITRCKHRYKPQQPVCHVQPSRRIAHTDLLMISLATSEVIGVSSIMCAQSP